MVDKLEAHPALMQEIPLLSHICKLFHILIYPPIKVPCGDVFL